MLCRCLAGDVLYRQPTQESTADREESPRRKRKRSKSRRRKSSGTVSSDRSLHDSVQPMIEVPKSLEETVAAVEQPTRQKSVQGDEQIQRKFSSATRSYAVLLKPKEESETAPIVPTRVYGDLDRPTTRVYGDLDKPTTRVYGDLDKATTRVYGDDDKPKVDLSLLDEHETYLEPLRKGFTVKKINSFNKRTIVLWININGDKLIWGCRRNSPEKTLELNQIVEILGSEHEDVPLGGAGTSRRSSDASPRHRKGSDSLILPTAATSGGGESESDWEVEEEENKAEQSGGEVVVKEKSKSTKPTKDAKEFRDFKIVIESKSHTFRTKTAADRAKIIKSLRTALDQFCMAKSTMINAVEHSF